MKQKTTQAAPMIAFARLTKIDEKNRLVYGRATQEVPDRQGEIMDYASSKAEFQSWSASQKEGSLGKSVGNVRAMHKDVAAGILTPENGIVFNDEERAIDICAKVTDDQEWTKCQTGTYTGFSVGGRYGKKWDDPDNKGLKRFTAVPTEISLVDRPAVPTATFFEMTKADGSVVKVEFQKGVMYKVAYRSGDEVGAEIDSRDIPELGSEFDIGERKFTLLKRDDEKKTVSVDVVYEVTGSPEEVGAFAKALGERGLSIAAATALVATLPVPPSAQAVEARAMEDAKAAKFDWVSKGDESDKRREEFRKAARGKLEQETADLLKKANHDKAVEAKARDLCKAAGKKPDDAIQVEGKPETKEPLWKGYVAAAEAELKKADAPAPAVVLVAGDVSPEILMKAAVVKVFADEENRRYPIDTDPQIKAAHVYFSMAEPNYPADVAKSIRGRIDAAAAEKKIDLAAIASKTMTVAELRKGMWSVSSLAQLIDSLCGLADSCEYEAFYEGDASGIAGELRAAVTMLGATLQRMAAEEVAEATKTGTVSAAVMAASERLGDLVKRLLPPDAPVAPTAEAIEALAISKLAKVEIDKDSVKGKELLPALRKAAELELQAEAKEALAKANTHAAVSKKHIQKVHDVACKMGAACSSGDDEDSEKVAKALAGALKKCVQNLDDAAALEQAKAILAAMPGTGALAKRAEPAAAPAADEMKKAVDAALAPVNAELKKALERVAKLEAQPMPTKVQLAVFKAQGKEVDTGADPALSKAAGEFTVVKNGRGEVDVAATIIKAQQTPGGVAGLQKLLEAAAAG